MKMTGPYMSMKMKKRKEVDEVDEVSDEFSDFSLSSPSLKIRRLDVEPTLPPIMEEVEQPEPVLNSESNDERALVLFNPVNDLHVHSPSNFFVDPDFISSFKNQIIWSNNSTHLRTAEVEAAKGNKSNGCMAVIPWVPSQFPITQGTSIPRTEVSGPMDADEAGEAAMDIEDNNGDSIEVDDSYHFSGMSGSGDSLPQQQQHCMVQQLHQNTSTPVTWFH